MDSVGEADSAVGADMAAASVGVDTDLAVGTVTDSVVGADMAVDSDGDMEPGRNKLRK